METLIEGLNYAVFDCTGPQLLASLPDESVEAVVLEQDGDPWSCADIARILKPGGLVFAVGPSWAPPLHEAGLKVFSDQTVCLAGKPKAQRFLFHAVTCTEDWCDNCSIKYLSELPAADIISELCPFVATGGTVAIPWGTHLIRPVVRHHRYALTAGAE